MNWRTNRKNMKMNQIMLENKNMQQILMMIYQNYLMNWKNKSQKFPIKRMKT